MYLQTLDTQTVNCIENDLTLEQLSGVFNESYVSLFADKFYNLTATLINDFYVQTIYSKEYISILAYVSNYNTKTEISEIINSNTMY